MDSPIAIIWVSPLSLSGESGVDLKKNQFFDENSLSKQNSPRWDAKFCGVTSGPIIVCICPTKRTPCLYEIIGSTRAIFLFQNRCFEICHSLETHPSSILVLKL